ncbi:MAG: hypothetical protein LCH78_18200 [Proteobacteria bacterium]|nr:hypothetical protein [Pseudomonadota bacterium]
MKRVEAATYTATIFVGGDLAKAKAACRAFCDEVGLCVTVEPTDYIYTGGNTEGVSVGLINYGRFPAEPAAIFAHAEALALKLIDGLGQESASIVATDRTIWLSNRREDQTA